jgi:glycogen synthase
VQVGGLAAVSAALPRALLPLADIRIVVPGYPQVRRGLANLEIVGNSPAFAGLPAFQVGKGHATDGMPYYVVLCVELFERPGSPYGDEQGVDWQDNDVRFATFSYAAAQIALGSIDRDWCAHLVHANDWQCALIPAYLEWSQRPLPTVFTIHNLAYQGLFSRDALPRLGIPAQSFHIDGVEFYDRLSLMKAGPSTLPTSRRSARPSRRNHHARVRVRPGEKLLSGDQGSRSRSRPARIAASELVSASLLAALISALVNRGVLLIKMPIRFMKTP